MDNLISIPNQLRLKKFAEEIDKIKPSEFHRSFFKYWPWIRTAVEIIKQKPNVLTEPKPQNTVDEKYTEEVIGLFAGEEGKDN